MLLAISHVSGECEPVLDGFGVSFLVVKDGVLGIEC